MSRDWTRTDARRLSEALELAETKWLEPVLPRLALPQPLADRPDAIAAAAAEFASARRTFEHDADPTIPAAVLRALRTIADATSPEDANAFQQWTRRHFICAEVPAALFGWRQVLIRATQPEGGIDRRVPPPASVESVLSDIDELLLGPHVSETADEIRQLAPPPSASDLELGLELPAAAERALEIARSESTISALRLLARHTPGDQIEALSRWAEEQGAELGLPAGRVEWSRYLSAEPTCADGPPAFRLGSGT